MNGEVLLRDGKHTRGAARAAPARPTGAEGLASPSGGVANAKSTSVFRQRSGSALCYACGKLNRVDAAVCFYCGRRHPGLWGFAPSLGWLFGRVSVAKAITVVCGVAYLAALALDPGAVARPRGVFNLLPRAPPRSTRSA